MPQSKEVHTVYMRFWRIDKASERYSGRYCRVCGYSRVLDQHHLDGNHDNNEGSNLLDLCPSCHALITRKLATISELLQEKDNAIEGV